LRDPNGNGNGNEFKPNIKLAIISSYKVNIIRLFRCKSSIIIMNISYSSEKRMKGNRKELFMKFVHECSNINCDKIIEFDYLKRFEKKGWKDYQICYPK